MRPIAWRGLGLFGCLYEVRARWVQECCVSATTWDGPQSACRDALKRPYLPYIYDYDFAVSLNLKLGSDVAGVQGAGYGWVFGAL
jgi:hypothetical protein